MSCTQFLYFMNWGFFSVVVFSDLTEDEKLAKLCQKLKEKHAGEPIILFIDENDITSTGNFSRKFSLKDLDDFHIISAISPIVENYVRLKSTGFDFNEMDIFIEDEKCLWVNMFLRYRNSSSIQNLCRNIGQSLREAVKFDLFLNNIKSLFFMTPYLYNLKHALVIVISRFI